MSRILYITHFTPTLDNYNGPSALMCHLLSSRPVDDTLIVYSTNLNTVPTNLLVKAEQRLKTKIKIIPKSFIQQLRTSNKVNNLLTIFHSQKLPADCNYSLTRRILKEIELYNPDVVFLYPHTMIKVAVQLQAYNLIVCGPDCVSLHYSRALRDGYIFRNGKLAITLKQYAGRLKMESAWARIPNARLYLVGSADTEYFNTINSSQQAAFFPHPHYKLLDKAIDLNKDKLRILISGKFDIYTYSDFTKLKEILLACTSEKLRKNLQFIFLGKDWETSIKELEHAGYDVVKQKWVEDYIDFITTCDIQIFPISVGSGTKGKVLDALSTGLLCIGSRYAYENIAVKDGESCLMYEDAKEITDMLREIIDNKTIYERIAIKGRQNIRFYHDTTKIISALFDWCINNHYSIETEHYFKLNLKS